MKKILGASLVFFTVFLFSALATPFVSHAETIGSYSTPEYPYIEISSDKITNIPFSNYVEERPGAGPSIYLNKAVSIDINCKAPSGATSKVTVTGPGAFFFGHSPRPGSTKAIMDANCFGAVMNTVWNQLQYFSFATSIVPEGYTEKPTSSTFDMILTSRPPFYPGSTIALEKGPIGRTGTSRIFFTSKTDSRYNFIVPAIGTNGWQITGTIPTWAVPGNYTIQVITNVPDTSNIMNVTISVPPKPAITTIIPTVIYPGTFIAIFGTNFHTTGNAVQFSSPNISISGQKDTPTNITGTISPSTVPGTYQMKVTNAHGTSNTVNITVKNKRKPNVDPSDLIIQEKDGFGDSIKLLWKNTNPPDYITKFNIERSIGESSASFKPVAATKGELLTSYSDNLTNSEAIDDRTLNYRIKAMWKDGSYSKYTNVASVELCDSQAEFENGKKMRAIYKKLPETLSGNIYIPWYLSSMASIDRANIQETIAAEKLVGKTVEQGIEAGYKNMRNHELEEDTIIKINKFIAEAVLDLAKKYKLSPEEGMDLFSGMTHGEIPISIDSFIFDPGAIYKAGFGSKIVYKVSKDEDSTVNRCIYGVNMFSSIAPVTQAPYISGITPETNSSQPNTFNVSGSDFDPKGNMIKLTPVSPTSMWRLLPMAYAAVDDEQFYGIEGISSNGTSMTFTVPKSVPDGVYKVSVSNSNSSWNDTSFTITVSGHGLGDQSTLASGDLLSLKLAIPAGSCSYKNNSAGKPVFSFNGSIMGATAPYTKTLSATLSNGKKKTALIKIPGTYTLNTTSLLSKVYVAVKSKDGQKVIIQCTSSLAPTSGDPSFSRTMISQLKSVDEVVTEPVDSETEESAQTAELLEKTSETTVVPEVPIESVSQTPVVEPVVVPIAPTPAATKPATQKYVCPAGYVYTPFMGNIPGQSCTFNKTYSIPATLKYVCPTGYKLQDSKSKTCIVAISAFRDVANVLTALSASLNDLFDF